MLRTRSLPGLRSPQGGGKKSPVGLGGQTLSGGSSNSKWAATQKKPFMSQSQSMTSLRGGGAAPVNLEISLGSLRNRGHMSGMQSSVMQGGTSLLYESRMRTHQSRQACIADRAQGQEFEKLNRALDVENEMMFRNIVRKKASLKVEALPLKRIAPDGEGLEPVEGNSQSSSTIPINSKGPSTCDICSMPVNPGQIVRQMAHCCNALFHVTCVRDWMARDARCPHCNKHILDNTEVQQLVAAVGGGR